ncbi:MAG: EamA family transporter [Gammaproteobacteria bacterium]|nr:MAG: EamA family transporter [Gammaproteobacteria bacterium]
MFYRQPTFQLACSSILFGLGAVFVVLIDLDASIIAFYRLSLGAVIFGFLLFLRRERLLISLPALLFASLSGVFLGLDLSLWNASILLVGPGIATILNSLQIFFMAAFGIVIYGNLPDKRLWLGLVITFVGVILLCNKEMAAGEQGSLGVVTGILSGLAYAISMLSIREAAKYQQHSLINTMFYASIAGALATGLYGIISDNSFITNELSSWLMIIIYGIFVHVLAWFLMAKSIPHVSLAIAGLLMALEPVVVFIVDLWGLDKVVSNWQVVGAVLTIVSVYLGTQSKHEESDR